MSLDRALYLLKSWTDELVRLAATHIPEAAGFAIKPVLAVEIIQRALAADVSAVALDNKRQPVHLTSQVTSVIASQS